MNRMEALLEAQSTLGSSFYFYDLDGFERHLEEIKETLHPEIKVWYACKANPMSAILKILHQHGFGADVASLGELKQARDCGFGASELIATGPAKSRSYLASLLQAQVRSIIIESEQQLKDLNDLCAKLAIKKSVLLRVQLEWSDTDKSVLGGSAITPFGLGPDDWKSINLKSYPHLNIEGLHCFQWGNILEEEHLVQIWESTIRACKQLAYDLGIELNILDLGGGLGLSYTDQKEMSFKAVHDRLVELKKSFELREIWLELGRFSIGKFGSYLTRVVDVKSVRGKKIIVTEGGINHLARPALVGEPFPCQSFYPEQEPVTSYSVHGPLCTALDFLGEHFLPTALKSGDWLEFQRAGAYGFTESMPYFLCHSLCGEVYLHRGEMQTPRVPRIHLDWLT
jgi:diaminopimelate decarboxylase